MDTFYVCRTCLQKIYDDPGSADYSYNHKLFLCMPEMDLRTISYVKICKDCKSALDIAYEFKLQCKEVEERITSYRSKHGLISLLEIPDSIVEKELNSYVPSEIERMHPVLIKEEPISDNDSNFTNYVEEHRFINDKFKNIVASLGNFVEEDRVANVCTVNTNFKLSSINHTKEPKLRNSYIYKSNVGSNISNQKKSFNCLLCKFTTNSNYYYKIHVLNHTDKRLFHCSNCDFATNIKCNWKRHILNNSCKKIFTCSQCEFTANNKASLRRHILTHTSKYIFECLNCEYKTDKKERLSRHFDKHKGEKLFECSQCEYKTYDSLRLKAHIFIHDDRKLPLYECTYCGYKTKCKSYLKTHVYIHTGEKPFKCSMCEFRTNYNYCLKTHIRAHMGEKPYGCLQCGYKTSDRSRLNKHFMIHTGEKPFECLQCGYKTCKKATLQRHIETHTKRFICDHCKFQTNAKIIYSKHIRKKCPELIWTKQLQCKNNNIQMEGIQVLPV